MLEYSFIDRGSPFFDMMQALLIPFVRSEELLSRILRIKRN
jgi:hypothetical protein